MLQLLLGVFSGSITPVQTAVNARLGRSVGSPLRASMVSFSVGLLSMLSIVLATGPYPLLSATAADGPWWMWLAGVFGVTFLTGNVLLLPKLGSLRTVIMPVTGQIVMGLLIDAFGWFGAQQRAISPLRVCGTVLAMAGFLLAVMGAGLQLGHRDAADDAGVRRHVDPCLRWRYGVWQGYPSACVRLFKRPCSADLASRWDLPPRLRWPPLSSGWLL